MSSPARSSRAPSRAGTLPSMFDRTRSKSSLGRIETQSRASDPFSASPNSAVMQDEDYSRKYFYAPIPEFTPPAPSPDANVSSLPAILSPPPRRKGIDGLRASTHSLRASSKLSRSISPTMQRPRSVSPPLDVLRASTHTPTLHSSIPERSLLMTKALLGPMSTSMRALESQALFMKPPSQRTEEDVERIFKRIKGLVAFEILESDYKIKELCKVMHYEQYKQDQVVFEKGDDAAHFYVIYHGSVAVRVDTSFLSLKPGTPNKSADGSSAAGAEEGSNEGGPDQSAVSTARTARTARTHSETARSTTSTSPAPDADKPSNKDAVVDDYPVQLIRGDMFGHFALSAYALSQSKGRNAAIVATSPCTELLRFDAYTYQRLVQFSVEKRIEENAEFLRGNTLFQTLPLASITSLAEVIRPRKFRDGETVFRVGDPLDGVYFVRRGVFMLQKESVVDTDKGKVRRTISMRKLGPGQFFGEVEMFSKTRRSLTVVAGYADSYVSMNKREKARESDGEPLCLFISKFDFMKRATLTLVQTMRLYVEREYPSDEALQRMYEDERSDKQWVDYKRALIGGILNEARTRKPASLPAVFGSFA